MTKEEILIAVQGVVIAALEYEDYLLNNPLFRLAWRKRQYDAEEAIKELNSCDAVWLNDEYAKWFRLYIEPRCSQIAPELRKHLSWV